MRVVVAVIPRTFVMDLATMQPSTGIRPRRTCTEGHSLLAICKPSEGRIVLPSLYLFRTYLAISVTTTFVSHPRHDAPQHQFDAAGEVSLLLAKP